MSQLSDNIAPIISDTVDTIVSASTEASSELANVFGINMELINQQADGMITGLSAFADKSSEIVEETMDTIPGILDFFRQAWETFISDQDSFVAEFAKRLVAVAKNVSKSIGDAFGATIVEGKNLMDGFKNIIKSVLKTLISALIEMGVQRLILAATAVAANVTTGSSEQARGLAAVYTNAFASIAAIPIVGPSLAPGAATAAMAQAAAGAVAAGSAGASIGAAIPLAHGGLDFVPAESTYLLDRGERVLSPRQNRDFTDFISEDGGGGGQSVSIESIQMSVLEGVTSIDNFLNLSAEEVKEVVAEKIITALDALDEEGIRPAFVDRSVNI